MSDPDVILSVRRLHKYFRIRKGFLGGTVEQVKAVDGVDLEIREGQTLGLVGESGCGKTTIGRTILHMIPATSGQVLLSSKRLGGGDGARRAVDVTAAAPGQHKALCREMQMIFQDPFSCLNPRMNVGSIVGEPLAIHGLAGGRERKDRVARLFEAVGLKADQTSRYPHEFSGGQRQRIGIARALALEPRLIVADEPVSALDVSIQAQILNLLKNLQQEFGLTYLFIAHDLSVIKYISNRVAVMYLGKIVETARTEDLFSDTRHPYTEALMSAVPILRPDQRTARIILRGDVPSPVNPPPGCAFHPRCRYREERCREQPPPNQDLGGGHLALCHFADSLKLRAIRGR